jgi:hypothetical protein
MIPCAFCLASAVMEALTLMYFLTPQTWLNNGVKVLPFWATIPLHGIRIRQRQITVAFFHRFFWYMNTQAHQPTRVYPENKNDWRFLWSHLKTCLTKLLCWSFWNYVPVGTSFWRCSGWRRQNQGRCYHWNWD